MNEAVRETPRKKGTPPAGGGPARNVGSLQGIEARFVSAIAQERPGRTAEFEEAKYPKAAKRLKRLPELKRGRPNHSIPTGEQDRVPPAD